MTSPPKLEDYHIYGDNILECERALNLMANAIADNSAAVTWVDSPLYVPKFIITKNGKPLFNAQLFPGYGRWPYSLQEHFRALGSPLREATDAVIVRLDCKEGKCFTAHPLLAFEFCGALPAGNQAWQ